MSPADLRALDALLARCEMSGAYSHAEAIFANAPRPERTPEQLADEIAAFFTGEPLQYAMPLMRAAALRSKAAFEHFIATPAATMAGVTLKLAVAVARFPGLPPEICEDVARIMGRDGAA